MSLIESTIKKPKRKVIKKLPKITKKKQIENKLNSFNIFNNELTYDLSVEDEYKSSLLERDMSIHHEIIKKLPSYNIDFKTKMDDEISDKKIKKKIEINKEVSNEEEVEEDGCNLPIEKVGNLYYKFDYDKGIIYDMKMNEVGHIDDYGEICILNENEEENEEDE